MLSPPSGKETRAVLPALSDPPPRARNGTPAARRDGRRAPGPPAPGEALQRQVKRPRVHRLDRVLLAAASRAPPRSTWSSFMVRPETLLRWHRELVAKKWGKDRGRRGRGHRGDHSQGERPPGRSRHGGALPVPQLHPSSLLPALPKLAGVLPLLYCTGCPRRTSSRRWPSSSAPLRRAVGAKSQRERSPLARGMGCGSSLSPLARRSPCPCRLASPRTSPRRPA